MAWCRGAPTARTYGVADETPRFGSSLPAGLWGLGADSASLHGQGSTQAKRHFPEIQGKALEAGNEILSKVTVQLIDTGVHPGREDRYILQGRRLIADGHDEFGLHVCISLYRAASAGAFALAFSPR